ncbi:MAG TPA: hypothetical protein VF697_24415, partial [Archangium sp.]
MDPAQQPQGYYGADGQWYAYPADYSQSGYDPQGYDPNQAYAQQPQGYYGADGQWYAYPAQGGYDPNQAYAQQPQGYYGADRQWYTYPAQGGYDPNQPYDPNQAYVATQGQPYADPQQAYAAVDAEQQPYPAYPQTAEDVSQPAQEPARISLESENLDVPALRTSAPWSESTPEPAAPVDALPELEAEPELEAQPEFEAQPAAEDVFEVSDTDVTPVSEATPIPERLEEPESVDMTGWEEPASAQAAEELPTLEASPEPEPSSPIELGEDDFSSLNSDLTAPAPASAPPVAEEPLIPVRTIEVQPTDIQLLEGAVEEQLAPEPVLAEEPSAPVSTEWDSAPLAVDQESGSAATPPHADAESSDLALLEQNRMEITASYAIPAYPTGDVSLLEMDVTAPSARPLPPLEETAAVDETPTFDVSDLEATPEAEPVPTLDMPWQTDAETATLEASPAMPAAEEPTFDVADLGAEVEPMPAPAFAVASHVTTLELNPVQVAPDLHADTVEIADTYEPGALQSEHNTLAWGRNEIVSSGEQPFDLAGDPGEPVPLVSTTEFLGHADETGMSVSSEPIPLETSDASASWSGNEGSSEGLQLESAAEYMSTPEFASASATWGHQPESEELAAETTAPEEAPENTTAYGDGLSAEGELPSIEAQPEWSASAEESAPIEVQAEWTSTEPATEEPVAEAQPEWATPAEEQPVLEAQSEWSAPAEEQSAIEVQGEWSAPAEEQPVEQPVLEAQPEWSATAEEQPVAEAQAEWAPPAEAQPEWSTPVEEQPVLEAQPEWSTPVEEQPVLEAQAEWATPAEEQPVAEAQPEWAT